MDHQTIALCISVSNDIVTLLHLVMKPCDYTNVSSSLERCPDISGQLFLCVYNTVSNIWND